MYKLQCLLCNVTFAIILLDANTYYTYLWNMCVFKYIPTLVKCASFRIEKNMKTWTRDVSCVVLIDQVTYSGRWLYWLIKWHIVDDDCRLMLYIAGQGRDTWRVIGQGTCHMMYSPEQWCHIGYIGHIWHCRAWVMH